MNQSKLAKGVAVVFYEFITICGAIAQSNALHQGGIPLLDRLPLRWGMIEAEALRVPGIVRMAYPPNQSEQYLAGMPYFILHGVDFPILLLFDQKPYRGNLEYLYPTGLNKVVMMKLGSCQEKEYRELKMSLADSFQVLGPESVSGETELKDREIWFGKEKNSIRLQSRCDNPHERYRWLQISIEPPGRVLDTRK